MRPTCLFLRSKRRLPLSCSCHCVPFPSLFVSTVQSPPPQNNLFLSSLPFPSSPPRTAAQTLQQHEPKPTEQNKKKNKMWSRIVRPFVPSVTRVASISSPSFSSPSSIPTLNPATSPSRFYSLTSSHSHPLSPSTPRLTSQLSYSTITSGKK